MVLRWASAHGAGQAGFGAAVGFLQEETSSADGGLDRPDKEMERFRASISGPTTLLLRVVSLPRGYQGSR